jgi:hypothetical protein
MKTYPGRTSAERATHPPADPRVGGLTAKATRALGDLVLLIVFVGLLYLFLSKNGFVGNSDIQPYPY